MDGQKLAALLQESQVPDTNRIKAVTAELQQNYYSRPESLLALIEIVCTHGDAGVRQQAAVQAARLVPRYWKKRTAEQKNAVHKHLLDATLQEQNARCRHSDAHLIAAIAAMDFDKRKWPELIPALFTLATNTGSVAQREIGSYIIYSTLEANPVIYHEHVARLLALFAELIKDPESAEVQINTVQAIGALLVLLEAEDDEDEGKMAAVAEAVRNLVPQMGVVLKNAVDGGDGDRIQHVFDVLQQFLVYSPSFLGTHLRSLLEFMLQLACNQEGEDEVRVQALSFLTQAVHYRRLKIQAMRDMPQQLVVQAMQILTEIGDDESADYESPGHVALSLLDSLASELPPRLVIVPLLDEFPKYAASADPARRKAAILALGNCAEGAPDFVNTQLKTILPVVVQLLNDADGVVRHAALVGLTGLAEEMPEDIAAEHEAIMAALVRNLQAAMGPAADEAAAKKNGQVLRAVCAAFDALSNGLSADKADVLRAYALQLIEPIGQLFAHPNTLVKLAAASALGAIAEALGEGFAPYFDKSMQALGAYVSTAPNAQETEEETQQAQLRCAVLDSIGRVALAVGPTAFQPYVVDLMKASEAYLGLGDDRLKESSFIFWSNMAKVYNKEFKPFLPGVLKALLEAVDGNEDDVVINLTEEEKAIIAAGVKKSSGGGKDGDDEDDEEDDEDYDDFPLDMDDDDDDDDDAWANMDMESEEKEVAIEVLGDVISNACGEEEMAAFLEKAVDAACNLTEHHYGGVRKAAIGLLWRAYARVWQLTEESTGVKWEPGFPPKQAPTPLLANLAKKVTEKTMALWTEETERDVVTDINRNVAATLQSCGPAVIAGENVVQEIVTALVQIITRSHPCQQDTGDEDGADAGGADDGVEDSEYDWLVIETAMEVVSSLATAVGPAFGELWKIFEKPMMKAAGATRAEERAAAVGTISSCVDHMGATVTPYTESLLKMLVHRLSDEDPDTKSNAAYGVGLVVEHSTASAAYLPGYATMLDKLGRLLVMSPDPGCRLYDNAAGALARLIAAHPDRVPLAECLPLLVERLPLKEDYGENAPVYRCLYGLYEHSEPTVQQLTPRLLGVFEQVLSPPEAQLSDETRALVKHTVQALYKAHPELFQGHEGLLKVAA